MSGLDREKAMFRAFEFAMKSDLHGDYLEFGVGRGVSLARALKAQRHFSEKLNHPGCRRFLAFDSFSGLPELEPEDRLEDYDVFAPGQYSYTQEDVIEHLRASGVQPHGVEFFAGFYEESLRDPAIEKRVGDAKASVVHIDCDLYSSARLCLRFLEGRWLDGAVILFDDWLCYRGRPDRGVRAAFSRWVSEAPVVATEYFGYSWAGKAFILNTRS